MDLRAAVREHYQNSDMENVNAQELADELKMVWWYIARECGTLNRRVELLEIKATQAIRIEALVEQRLCLIDQRQTVQNLWEVVMVALYIMWTKIQQMCTQVGLPRMRPHPVLEHIVSEPECAASTLPDA